MYIMLKELDTPFKINKFIYALDLFILAGFTGLGALFQGMSGIFHIQLSDRLFFNGTVICQSAETQFSVDIYSAAKNAESNCISLFTHRIFKE